VRPDALTPTLSHREREKTMPLRIGEREKSQKKAPGWELFAVYLD